MAVTTLPKRETRYTEAEWQARVDLAAAHRLSVMHGFQEGIFNHLTLTVPGKEDRYLQIPFGLHWSEVTASSFMEIGFDGTRHAGEGEMELSCYCIHAPIHRLVPDAACVMHTHMPYASALARLEDPRILPIGQTELGMMMQTGYDMDYAGPAFDPKEGGTPRRGARGQDHPHHGQPRGDDGGAERGRSLRSPLLHRAGGPGTALRDVDRPAAPPPLRRGHRGDHCRVQGRAALRRPVGLRAPLRCPQASARAPGGDRLPGLRRSAGGAATPTGRVVTEAHEGARQEK